MVVNYLQHRVVFANCSFELIGSLFGVLDIPLCQELPMYVRDWSFFMHVHSITFCSKSYAHSLEV